MDSTGWSVPLQVVGKSTASIILLGSDDDS